MALNQHDTAAKPEPRRNPVLDRAYAAGATEEPPAHLDAAILAAARREVRAGPRSAGSLLHSWRAPLALAAVLVLSVSVVILMREEGADRLDRAPPPAAHPAQDQPQSAEPVPPTKLESTPAPAPSKDVASKDRGAPAPQAVPAPRAVPAEEEDRRKEGSASDVMPKRPQAAEAPRLAPRPFTEPPAAPAESRRSLSEAPPPQPAAPAKEIESGAAVPRDRAPVAPELQAQRAPAPPAAAALPDAVGGLARQQAKPTLAQPERGNRMEQKARDDAAPSSAPSLVWQAYERQPPEKWLERVEELRRAGRDAEAREMLAEFHRRFPQHPVPPALER
jgi:hypothetical protein